MSKDVPPRAGSFDLEKLQELVELMEKHGLNEVSLKRGDEHWRLKRGATEMLVPGAFPSAMPPPQAAPPPPVPTEAAAEKPDKSLAVIKSPTVGTFYSAPSPDDPVFVLIGSKVTADTIVCIVEAMKVFNQIPADVVGTITEILVENGDPVEFGQALFRVRLG